MPIIVPNSWGTLREFNPCHDPKTGQFAFKGQGDCEPGNPEDPGRVRAVFGQFVPDSEGLAFDAREAEHAESMLQPEDYDRSGAKDKIARELAHALVDHEGLYAFYHDEHVGGFARHYSTEAPAPDPDADWVQENYKLAKRQAEGSRGEDPEKVRDLYDDYARHFEGPDAPSPVEAHDEYSDWVLEQEEVLQNEQYESAYEHAVDEFNREGDRLLGDSETLYDEAKQAFSERARELRDELLPYGDVSEHPTLPGLDVDRSQEAILRRYSQENIIDQWNESGEDAEFLQDREFMAAMVLSKTAALPAFDRDLALAGTEFDPNDEEAKKKFIDGYLEGWDYDYSSIDSFQTWYKDKYGFAPDEWEEHHAPPSFTDWYTERYGFAPEQYTGPGEPYPSFEDWYERQYGFKPGDWKVDPARLRAEREAMARNVASGLIASWAETSSDAAVRSLALQLVAEQHFGLGATYSKTISQGGSALLQARAVAERHRPLLSAFLQRMYDNTQQWLKAHKIGKDGYVTLYRGWAARSQQEPGLKTVNLEHGSAVDVLLQPMSSFSVNYLTARSFSQSSGANTPMISSVRVPINRILATARTGYGCLNEGEFVVLGGRYPAFVQGYRWSSTNPRSFLANALRFLPKGKVVVGPGDRV